MAVKVKFTYPKNLPLMEMLEQQKFSDQTDIRIFKNWYRPIAVIKSDREMRVILKDVKKFKELQKSLQNVTLSDNGDGWINIAVTAKGFLQQNKITGRKRHLKKWAEITKIEDFKKENS